MKKAFFANALVVSVCSLGFVFTACDDGSSTGASRLSVSDADFVEDDLSSASDKKSSAVDKVSSSSKKDEAVTSSNQAKSSSSANVGSSDSKKSKFDYGTLIDERDGQKYKTIKIGKQNWMAENLNFDYNKGSAKSYCYDDDPENCDTYGRLYTWAAAMDSAAAFSKNSRGVSSGRGCGDGLTCHILGTVRGVCPEGWHLPRKTEVEVFFDAIGGKDGAVAKLKSTSGWLTNGEDSYGFSVLPAGDKDGDTYEDLESYATFWNARDGSDGYAENWYVKNSNEHVFQQAGGKGVARSVRCVEDTVVKARFEYGSFTDERDGQIYKTIEIGTQTWMAENLNYKIGEGSGKSFCYNDDEGKCDTYGRLYDWLGALNSLDVGEVASEEGLIVQGVCPENWHLPSKVEVKTLRDFVDADEKVDGKLLKSVDGWWNGGTSNGTDEFGFAALPTGFRTKGGSYDELGYSATFWSWEVTGPESEKKLNANEWYFENGKDYGVQSYTENSVGRSVRCIKNAGASI